MGEVLYYIVKMQFSFARKILAVGAIVTGICAAGVVYAATPTMSLSSAGGSSVTVNVYGDPNANATLYYNVGSQTGLQSMALGTTNASGYLSTVVSGYNVNAGQNAYVIVNGQQSSMQAWPIPSGTPTFNQSSVTVGVGQSVSIYSQGGSAPIYMASNSNSSVASVQANGTQLKITAQQPGSTNVSICYVGTANNCANVPITVQTGSVVTFSQNNLSLGVGQGATVTVSGGNGTYSITGNSNPNIASAVLSGTTITISSLQIGTTNITACDSAGNCGTLYITVSTSAANGSLYFSSTNPSLSIGQTITVTVSGGSNYYVTGNSNPNVASQTLNGNTLTISGLQNGATTITVCSSSSGCGMLSVNVGSAGTMQVTFGISNPTVPYGQNMSISLSGGSGYYISSNANTSIAQASINGSSLSLYGAGIGSDSVIVCITGGGCGTLPVTVGNGSGTTVTQPSSGGTTSGGTSSEAALLAAIQSMQSQLGQLVAQIQSMATTLTQLAGTVASSGGSSGTVSSPSTSGVPSFTEFLSVGSEDAEVSALQQYLTQKGFYDGPVTGFYGSATESAVKSYQAAHGITAAGYVGPSTRAALNAGE